MLSTPVMGNGRQGNSHFQEGTMLFGWLTEKRLVAALSAKQEYEVRSSVPTYTGLAAGQCICMFLKVELRHWTVLLREANSLLAA
jgi:hypothetical protein